MIALNILCQIIGATIAAFCSAVLADGRSVIVMKDAPPPITNPAVINASAKFLLGATYGAGLHHDWSGRSWDELDDNYGTLTQIIAQLGVTGTLQAVPTAISDHALMHPIAFLECKDLQDTGKFTMILGFIGVSGSVFIVLLHGVMMICPMKPLKMFLVLNWVIYVVAFIVVVVKGYEIYDKEWTCDNPVIPTLTLSESFDLSYGINFAIIGIVGSAGGLVFTISAPAAISNMQISSSSSSSSSSSKSSATTA